MRRLLRIFLPVLLISLLLFGCAVKDPTPENISGALANPYEAELQVRSRGLEMSAVISKQTPGYCNVEFTAPALLNGLSMQFKPDSADISYKGLSVSVDPASLPESAVAKLVVAALDQVTRQDGLRVQIVDSALVISGTSDSTTFYLSLDSANYNILKLRIPSEELEIDFINFSFVNQ